MCVRFFDRRAAGRLANNPPRSSADAIARFVAFDQYTGCLCVPPSRRCKRTIGRTRVWHNCARQPRCADDCNYIIQQFSPCKQCTAPHEHTLALNMLLIAYVWHIILCIIIGGHRRRRPNGRRTAVSVRSRGYCVLSNRPGQLCECLSVCSPM